MERGAHGTRNTSHAGEATMLIDTNHQGRSAQNVRCSGGRGTRLSTTFRSNRVNVCLRVQILERASLIKKKPLLAYSECTVYERPQLPAFVNTTLNGTTLPPILKIKGCGRALITSLTAKRRLSDGRYEISRRPTRCGS